MTKTVQEEMFMTKLEESRNKQEEKRVFGLFLSRASGGD